MAGTKNNASMPKDLQAMSNILKDFGIADHEPGVENHMLDFTNRYVTTLIEDALLYSTHAGKKCIDIDDVKLAIELQQDKIYTSPPSREKMFPIGTKIITYEFESTMNYTAELRLKCKTKEEFDIWLTDFQIASNTIYCVLNTTPRTGQKVLYKAVYRCHHNTHPYSHKVKTPTKKHTGCSAKLKVSIKAPMRPKSRTQDPYADYPIIVKVCATHNHEVNAASSVKYKDVNKEVREKFIELFRSQHGPAKALELHKRDLLEEHEDDYYTMQADRSICPDLQWTYKLYYKIFLKEFGETSLVIAFLFLFT